MKYGLSSNNLNRILKIFKQFPAVETVYLYGSRAKGNYKPSSDIDIVLKGNKLDLSQLSSIMTQLDDLLLPNQFDVSLYHQIDNKELLEHINRVGIPLYSSTNSVLP
jgi:predicted nucleotidyltransferase